MNAGTPQEKALLFLHALVGISSAKLSRLLKDITATELLKNPVRYEAVVKKVAGDAAYAMLNLYQDGRVVNDYLSDMARQGVSYLTIESENYPSQLKEIDLPPYVLYYKGDLSLLDTPMLAVVGSREPSRNGEETTARFVGVLARAGLTIVSGAARGVDGIAHVSCLNAGGKTVGVLGCGINKVYPPENDALYARIEKEGLLVSEYGLNVPPNNYQFPERNRIISGLSLGVLVTEARKKSGSLITANCAIEQGRNLYALPSSLNIVRAEGSNELIKKHNSAFITTPDDILEDLRLQTPKIPTSPMQLDFAEAMVLEALGYQNLHFEELLQITGLGVAQLNALLTKMELLELLVKLDKNMYGVS